MAYEVYKVIDLFAGCGGLSLGFERAGFDVIGYEIDTDCCQSYNNNLKGKCHNIKLTRDFEITGADIIIAGPPCQPFSLRGKQKGVEDSRNGFPIFLEAIKKNRPKICLFENVKGLLLKNKPYFDELIAELENLDYKVDYSIVNAVDYEVPQNRERVIVVAHKGNYSFPQKIDKKKTAGEALGELATSIPDDAIFLTPSMDLYISKYEFASKCAKPRDLHLDIPARTLTCRNLAGATSDMHRIKLPDGRRRRLTTKEAALLQSFPNEFEFYGSQESIFKQIGNAVPPLFAYHLAVSIMEYMRRVS